MTKKLSLALACAAALGATAAPAANAGTVCQTASERTTAALQKSGLYDNFETVYVHMGDEIPFVLNTACSNTP